MSYMHDDVLDAALDYIDTNTENLYLCSAEPSDFTEASSTYKLGTKATPTVSAPTNGDVSGRKITVSAFADGSVSATGTATHWALTDDSASKLLAAGALYTSKSVTNGDTFALSAFDIEILDPS